MRGKWEVKSNSSDSCDPYVLYKFKELILLSSLLKKTKKSY